MHPADGFILAIELLTALFIVRVGWLPCRRDAFHLRLKEIGRDLRRNARAVAIPADHPAYLCLRRRVSGTLLHSDELEFLNLVIFGLLLRLRMGRIPKSAAPSGMPLDRLTGDQARVLIEADRQLIESITRHVAYGPGAPVLLLSAVPYAIVQLALKRTPVRPMERLERSIRLIESQLRGSGPGNDTAAA